MTTRPPNRRGILVSLSALPWPLAARASAPAQSLTPDQTAAVARARAYLQGLKSAKGRFVQTDPRGAISAGSFYLQRPGRARFEYDPPSGLVIASNGFRVAIVDTRLKTIQAYPLGMTPLGLLLSKDIRIDRGVEVGKVITQPDGFSIVARDGTKRAQGQITLDFTDPPVALAGWTITDPQGGATRVKLVDFAPAARFPWTLFELSDPRQAQAIPSG
jgi:outer membrane lipoprotein-sorting protein